ncbi:hypothetical protein ABLN87_00165 [Ruegeria sp. SCPT10]|uniref:hypothetical protein n=1 Tax=Ruegeria sp. SCP10 TaxID=3141377 RepID=UPI003339B325
MADNVVKAGIEDVLSSVKRLVSEEGKAGKGADQSAKARKPGRLVLTDALRISKPAAAETGPLKLEPEYSAEVSAKPMLLRACDIVRDDAGADQEAPSEVAMDEQSDDPTLSLSAKIEALEAAIARTEDQWEPDGDSDDAYSGTPNQSLSWDTGTAFAESDGQASLEEQPEDAQPESDQVVSDEEEPVVETPRQEELESDEAQPATFIRSAEAEPVTESAEQETALLRELSVDEEALRSMIAEVVREELKGALGERITRNVRKMVRREIYRALAAQELE